jgi:hypothetical protein
VPAPGVLSTSIRPPCLSTIARALASPRAGAGDRVALGLLGAEEAVEDARQLLLGDAAAGVGDGDPDDAVVPLGRDVDTSARLGELERVRDEVVDDLTEPHAVAAHLHGQPAVAVAGQLDLTCRRRRGGRHGMPEELVDVEGGAGSRRGVGRRTTPRPDGRAVRRSPG